MLITNLTHISMQCGCIQSVGLCPEWPVSYSLSGDGLYIPSLAMGWKPISLITRLCVSSSGSEFVKCQILESLNFLLMKAVD